MNATSTGTVRTGCTALMTLSLAALTSTVEPAYEVVAAAARRVPSPSELSNITQASPPAADMGQLTMPKGVESLRSTFLYLTWVAGAATIYSAWQTFRGARKL